MSLITLEELIRGGCIAIGGGIAGTLTIALPGSPLWLLPAGAALAGCALTVPEIRQEAARALPLLAAARKALPLLTEARRALPERRRGQHQHRAQTDAPQPQARQQPRAAQRPRWLEVVNDDLDRAPHALIIGPSGAGKTTLATALMGDRGGRSVVISPKISAGAWAGAEVITLDDDGSYAPLVEALADLEEEKRRRIVTLRREGPDALEPITIVLDELQDLTAHVPAAGEFMVNLSSIGREIKMRLVGVGTTDDALNIRGWKASRRNYVRMELDRNRRATLDDSTRTISINPTEIQPLARRARLLPWREPAREPETPPVQHPAPTPRATPQATAAQQPEVDPFLSALLAESVPSASECPRNAHVPVTSTSTYGNSNTGNSGVTITTAPGNGTPSVIIHASATATGSRRRTYGRGLDMHRRRVTAERTRKKEALRNAYRNARTSGAYKSFRAAYEVLGGNRDEAHQAWKSAAPGEEAIL
jgi:GTPase SAR1 family protein